MHWQHEAKAAADRLDDDIALVRGAWQRGAFDTPEAMKAALDVAFGDADQALVRLMTKPGAAKTVMAIRSRIRAAKQQLDADFSIKLDQARNADLDFDAELATLLA